MADWDVLQVAEAASEDKKVLGRDRECRKNLDLHCNNRLLHDGDYAEKDGCQTVNLRDAATCKYLTYRDTKLKNLFEKSNFNIVNELDDSSEPTLF